MVDCTVMKNCGNKTKPKQMRRQSSSSLNYIPSATQLCRLKSMAKGDVRNAFHTVTRNSFLFTFSVFVLCCAQIDSFFFFHFLFLFVLIPKWIRRGKTAAVQWHCVRFHCRRVKKYYIRFFHQSNISQLVRRSVEKNLLFAWVSISFSLSLALSSLISFSISLNI